MVKKRHIFAITIMLAFLIQIQLLPAIAAEPAVEELTLKQAMQKALNYSKDLRNTELDKEIADINLNDINNSMDGVRYGYNIPDETEQSVYKNYFQINLSYRLAEKKIDNIKKQAKVDVKKAYYDVLLAQEQIDLAKKQLALTLVQHSKTNTKMGVGLATQMDVYAANAQLEADKANLDAKSNDLTKAYSQLNKLIGNPQDARPKLTDTITYAPVDKLDTDTEVLKAVNNSFEIWSAEEAAKAYENMKYYQKYYDIGEYNAAQYANTLKDTKEQIQLTARNLCLSIQNMEKSYLDIEAQEKQLEETQRVFNSMYQVGMKTKDEVDDITLKLANIKVAKDSLAVDYTNALENLQRLTGDLKPTIE